MREHKPLTDLQIKRMKPGKKKENQHLDFKREWWHGTGEESPGEEAAKDVAMLANAEGGDIIVGAAERAGGAFDHFHDWNMPTNPKVFKKEPIEDFLKLASAYLRPRDFVESLRLRVLEPPGAPCPILVITVPKAPALVGCADSAGHEARIRYPIRTETRTDFIDHAEVVRRTRDNDAWKRFRFRNLMKRNLPITLFTSMVMQFRDKGGNYFVDALGGASRVIWKVESLEDDCVVLHSQPETFGRGVLPRAKHYRYAPIPDSTLAVPYELIRTVWVSNVLTETAHMMLDGAVGLMYEHPIWALFLRNPDMPVIDEEPVHWTDAPDNPKEIILVGPEGIPCVLHPYDPPNWCILRTRAPPPETASPEPEWTEEECPI